MKNKRNNTRNGTKSASLLAYEQIKAQILQNELDSKKPLDEKAFSKELHTSRTPIREALIMLEKDGLVSRGEGRGFYIKQFRMRDVQDLYEFREIVETAIAPKIISNMDKERIQALSRILDRVQVVLKKGDPAEIIPKSFEFHTRFIELCDNSIIIDFMRNCHEKILQISWACKEYASSPSDYEEHRAILSALQKRDLKKLQMKIREHISGAKKNAIGIMKSDMERLYFHP